MDVLLLGALVVVLIGITVWLVVWPGRPAETSTEPEEGRAQPAQPEQSAYQVAAEPWSSPTLAHEGLAPLDAPPRPQPVEPRKRAASTPLTFGLFASLLLALGGGAWLYWNRRRQRRKPVRRFRRRFSR